MNDYYQNLPKKHMSSGVIFTSESGSVLLVKPTYRDYWILPGGVVEVNESPTEAAVREICEELGLVIEKPRFIRVDYKWPTENKPDSLHFIFFGGVLNSAEISNITLPSDELSEYRFLRMEELSEFTSQTIARKIQDALSMLDGSGCGYFEV